MNVIDFRDFSSVIKFRDFVNVCDFSNINIVVLDNHENRLALYRCDYDDVDDLYDYFDFDVINFSTGFLEFGFSVNTSLACIYVSIDYEEF